MMPCAACGTPFEVRRKDHRFCSAKCRLAGFQQKEERARRERDARARLLLRTVIESAQAATQLLEEPPDIPQGEIDRLPPHEVKKEK